MDEPARGRFRKLLGGGRKKSKAPVAENDSPVVDDVEDPVAAEPELDLFAEPEPREAPEPVAESESEEAAESVAVDPEPVATEEPELIGEADEPPVDPESEADEVEERKPAKHAKSKSKKDRWVVIVAALVAIAAIAGGIIFWALTARNNDETAAPARVSLLPARPTTSAPPQETGDVVVRVSSSFSPSSVTINAGQTVTWIFDDGKKHAVQGLKDNGQIINGPVMFEGKYSVLFDRAGTFEYIDSLYPDTRGKVIVVK